MKQRKKGECRNTISETKKNYYSFCEKCDRENVSRERKRKIAFCVNDSTEVIFNLKVNAGLRKFCTLMNLQTATQKLWDEVKHVVRCCLQGKHVHYDFQRTQITKTNNNAEAKQKTNMQ